MAPRLLFFLALAFSLSAQAPNFQTGVSIVEVDAQVVEKTGVIEGLGCQDFALQDNRRPVALRDCLEEETPLDLVLLYELSRFMPGKLNELRAASEIALSQIRPGDRVAVQWFSEQVQLAQPFTADLRDLKGRLRLGLAEARFGGLPFLLPAVHEAAVYLGARSKPRGRGVVLLFSGDAGYADRNQNHLAVARDLWEADASLAAMVIPNVLTRITNDDNPFHIFKLLALGFNLSDYVDDVVRETGGEMVITADANALHRTPNPHFALQQMLDRLRKRYRLYYDMPPGKPGETRRIALDLSPAARVLHPDAKAIGRKGYVIPKATR